MKRYVLFLLLPFMALFAKGQIPFHRGVNLTGWFQKDNVEAINFDQFGIKDFIDIQSLGCDVIRLPISLHSMTTGEPGYRIDPRFLAYLDSAVNWAERLKIYLIIDNHSFHPTNATDPAIGEVLNKVWPQLAERYSNRSEYIIYEILNEPHGISNELWGKVQQKAIEAIRAKDKRHTIIVGPSGYNGYNDLAQMPIYSDRNLIYTFHFYDPFMFTHQGASWNSPSMVSLKGIPFPYNAATMPKTPSEFAGTWVENAMNSYPSDGTVEKVKSLIDIAVKFRDVNKVNVYCGEFGVYIPNSSDADRVFWYKTVTEYLNEKSIPWTIWDYKGGFGIFRKGSQEKFETDLNIPLVKALGLKPPYLE